ncbi:response regulator protein (plasmid) [Rhizobium etli bv. mimosae str. Mim1]|nr:response regulator protein [Rhizobium etli bv. mimosae str. Mim1]
MKRLSVRGRNFRLQREFGTRRSWIMQRPFSFAGRFYLIVEDEYLAASSMVMALEDAGAEVAGPVSNVAGALKLVSERACEFDAAILDINLRGTMAHPVAERLAEQGIPFVVVTG